MQPFPGLARWSRQVQLPVSRTNLHFYDTGEDSKIPILLLHGLGDEADTWRHVLPFISGTYRAIAPDLPGFGRSEKLEGKVTIPSFIDCILELMDHLSISRFGIVGHSMGAMIAQAIALEHPERVERQILISGSLVSQNNRIDPGLLFFFMPGLGEWMYNRLRKNPQSTYNSLEPYYHRLEDLSQADRDFLYQRVNERVWSDRQRQGFLSTLRSLAGWIPSIQKTLPARLAGWKIPTTIVWGENDQINSIANAHALIKMLPSARLVIVPDAGHNIQQEKAEVVTQVINSLYPG